MVESRVRMRVWAGRAGPAQLRRSDLWSYIPDGRADVVAQVGHERLAYLG